MKIPYLSYFLGALVLFGLYASFLPRQGLRLSVYYTPEGSIIPIHNELSSTPMKGLGRILQINGQGPHEHSAVFFHSPRAKVLTESKQHKIKTIPNNVWKLILDFKYFIISSFLFLFCAIWFYHNTRDIHLIVLNTILSIFYFSFVVLLARHKLLFLFQVSALALIPAFFNMGLRTTGRHVSNYLAIGEINFILFVSLLAYLGSERIESIGNINFFISCLCFFTLVAVLALHLRRCLQKTSDRIENLKHWALFAGLLLGVFLPLSLAMLSFFAFIAPLPFHYLAIINFLFPCALFYGTYRLQLMPFQMLFSKSLLLFLQGAFFACIYGFAIAIQDMLLSPQEKKGYEWILHLLFILTLIFFLDPIKYFLSFRLGKIQLWGEDKLEASLRKMFSLITSDRRIQAAADTLLEEVKKTLAVEKVDMLLSENAFPGLKLRKNRILRLENTSPLWKYLQEYHFVVTDYLTYGGGIRKKLFHFLFQNDHILAVGVQGLRHYKYKFRFPFFTKRKEAGEGIPLLNMKAALLIGYRKKRNNFKISESRYLYEAANLMNILIRNYAILLAEIEKRQRIRELQVAGQVQRKLPEIKKEEYPGVHFSHSSQPALSVSGDYFDAIPLKNNKLACFLGDVSGHGLGTGYLASSLRAIVRSQLEGGAKLKQTIETLNRFLMDRYQGDEFLTLFALLLNTKTGELEYINAAHPAPYWLKGKKGELKQLKDFQPVIGVLGVPYNSHKIKLSPKDRLFLYSDGVTETFNLENVAFGEKKLEVFLDENKNLPLEEIIKGLEQQLLVFRERKNPGDDTSIAALELRAKSSLFENTLDFAYKRLLKLIS